ncbi:Tubulin-specific chaperone C [Fasciola gigantica]|uniref:Tubulin-specific chaperone C n=1 Tax=Fasciola gigantica TaxID=46835 RepID=A0A504Y550_FASGI|nr:Tubulin-specific chaperone C [Fasciola gigantica]
MSTSDQGDSVSVIPGTKSAREALFDRLAERHAQVKAAQLSRRNHVQMQPGTEACEASKLTKQNDFLSNFLQTKTDILADLDRAADQTRTDSLSTSDLTKNLQTQFQSKREELLPTRKFKFTRNRVQKTTTPAVSEVTSTSEITEHSGHIPSSLTKFDERFSLTNFEHDCQLVIPKPGCTDSIGVENSVYLAQLNRCTVHVRDVCGNLIARGLQNCRVYIYPVAGSVWLENCHQCDFVLASRQLRIHRTTDCRLGLHMASRPIIENSTGLQVAPYRLQYAALQSDLTRAGLSAEVNLWREVEDFSHPNKRLTTGSPNWSILPETEWNSLKANE